MRIRFRKPAAADAGNSSGEAGQPAPSGQAAPPQPPSPPPPVVAERPASGQTTGGTAAPAQPAPAQPAPAQPATVGTAAPAQPATAGSPAESRPADSREDIAGLRAWLAQIDRGLGLRTYIGAGLVVLALAAAAVALVLTLSLKQDSPSQGEVDSLRDQLTVVEQSASQAAQTGVKSLNQRLTALEGELDKLTADQTTSKRELQVVQDDIKELRSQVAGGSQTGTGSTSGTGTGFAAPDTGSAGGTGP